MSDVSLNVEEFLLREGRSIKRRKRDDTDLPGTSNNVGASKPRPTAELSAELRGLVIEDWPTRSADDIDDCIEDDLATGDHSKNKKQLHVSIQSSSFGSLVWGRVSKTRWWPGIIIDGTLFCQPPPQHGWVWLMWFGDFRITKLPLSKIEWFGCHYEERLANTGKKAEPGVAQALQVCATRLGLELDDCETVWTREPAAFCYILQSRHGQTDPLAPKPGEEYPELVWRSMNEFWVPNKRQCATEQRQQPQPPCKINPTRACEKRQYTYNQETSIEQRPTQEPRRKINPSRHCEKKQLNYYQEEPDEFTSYVQKPIAPRETSISEHSKVKEPTRASKSSDASPRTPETCIGAKKIRLDSFKSSNSAVANNDKSMSSPPSKRGRPVTRPVEKVSNTVGQIEGLEEKKNTSASGDKNVCDLLNQVDTHSIDMVSNGEGQTEPTEDGKNASSVVVLSNFDLNQADTRSGDIISEKERQGEQSDLEEETFAKDDQSDQEGLVEQGPAERQEQDDTGEAEATQAIQREATQAIQREATQASQREATQASQREATQASQREATQAIQREETEQGQDKRDTPDLVGQDKRGTPDLVGEPDLASCFGRLVWGRLSKTRWWPGIIIDGTLVGQPPPKPAWAWLMWFGDFKITMLPLSKVEWFGCRCEGRSFVDLGKLAETSVTQAFQVCAARLGVELADHDSVWSWVRASDGFTSMLQSTQGQDDPLAPKVCAVRLGVELADHDSVWSWVRASDGFTSMLQSTQGQDDPLAPKVGEEYPELILAALQDLIGARSTRAAQYSKKQAVRHKPKRRSKYRADLLKLEKEMAQKYRAAIEESWAALKPSNQQTLATSRPAHLSHDGPCLSCTKPVWNGKAEHPLFEGTICLQCKDEHMEAMFAVDDDGSGVHCSICSQPGSMIVCEARNCARSYCMSCLAVHLGQDKLKQLQELGDGESWSCFLCSEHRQESHGDLKSRSDWQHRIVTMFNPSDTDTETREAQTTQQEKRERGAHVLSLADGIGATRVALDHLGIHVDNYYAAEINQHAANITICKNNKVTNIGNILDIDETLLEQLVPIDLVVAAPPVPTVEEPQNTDRELVLKKCIMVIKQLQATAKKDGRVFHWLLETPTHVQAALRKQVSQALEMEPMMWDAQFFSPVSLPKFYWGNIPHLNSAVSWVEQHGIQTDLDTYLVNNSHISRQPLVSHIRPSVLQGLPAEFILDKMLGIKRSSTKVDPDEDFDEDTQCSNLNQQVGNLVGILDSDLLFNGTLDDEDSTWDELICSSVTVDRSNKNWNDRSEQSEMEVNSHRYSKAMEAEDFNRSSQSTMDNSEKQYIGSEFHKSDKSSKVTVQECSDKTSQPTRRQYSGKHGQESSEKQSGGKVHKTNKDKSEKAGQAARQEHTDKASRDASDKASQDAMPERTDLPLECFDKQSHESSLKQQGDKLHINSDKTCQESSAEQREDKNRESSDKTSEENGESSGKTTQENRGNSDNTSQENQGSSDKTSQDAMPECGDMPLGTGLVMDLYQEDEDPFHFRLPVTWGGYPSELFTEEMEKLMGFDRSYTDLGSKRGVRMQLLSSSSSVHVLKHLLTPLIPLWLCKTSEPDAELFWRTCDKLHLLLRHTNCPGSQASFDAPGSTLAL